LQIEKLILQRFSIHVYFNTFIFLMLCKGYITEVSTFLNLFLKIEI